MDAIDIGMRWPVAGASVTRDGNFVTTGVRTVPISAAMTAAAETFF